MAGEEDVELRDLVAQSLEAKGVLGKIRAQLRANVFLALEEQESQEKPHPFVSEKLRDFQRTKEGRQAVALVREFLQFFDLDFTTAVFDPETSACDTYPGREQLARELSLDHDSSPDSPLISSLLRRSSHPHTHPHLPTSPSHSPLFTTAHPSLHTAAHHLPSHVATFPASLTAHHHTSSHPHISMATDRTHTITNGNSLPSPSSDQTLSKPRHHQSTSSSSAGSVVTTNSSVSTTTSDITTVTSGLTIATTTGGEVPGSNTLPQGREKDVLTRLTGSAMLKDPSLTFSTSQSFTDKLTWGSGGGGDRRGGGLGVLGELPTTESSRLEMDDFFKTSPPTTDPVTSGQHPAARDDSESSVSEQLEDESVGSGKTTDVTQTDNSLRGEYDFETQILPQEQ